MKLMRTGPISLAIAMGAMTALAANALGQSDSKTGAPKATAKADAPKGGAAKAAIPLVSDHGVPQVREINQQIRQVWTDMQLSPSPPAADGEWCRRVYLDVIGRVPSVQELRDYLGSKDADKKVKLVNRLLNDEAFQEE